MYHEELKLEEPNLSHEKQHQEMLEEFINEEEIITPRTMRKRPHEDYQQFLQRTRDRKQGINLPEQRVPGSLYFIIDKQGKIVGGVSVRHTLNKALERLGWHIGYWIRPSERKKWYATLALTLALRKCKELGIKKAMVICKKENIGSAKVIQKNGGILESEYICKENENTPTQRRFITI